MSSFETSKPSLWLIDSGATNNLTCDREVFTELDKSYSSVIRVANGAEITSEGIGTIVFKNHSGSKLVLNVLYVPQISENLLSVPQLLKNGYKVLFEHESCMINDQNNEEVFKIQMKKNRFYLELTKNLKDDEDERDLKKTHVKAENEGANEKVPFFLTKVKNHRTAKINAMVNTLNPS
ncbi:uncharacterized protein [Medicago truncatula]|uniref:uncharacterized protein n=1 Tax=Medicago truncatula TaxID=3880 RepID=UPI000D2F44DB|nr:uncharacterized protein LOC112422064 [Medicago truncatula]